MAEMQSCVLTNMCMITQDDRMLVQDRLDPNWPGITFPGGHVEPGESFVRSVQREVREETGLMLDRVRLCGVKQFPLPEGRYIVLFFKADSFTGTLRSSKEGKVFWVKREELSKLTLADGFESMLEVFENDQLSENFLWQEEDVWHTENL